ncbi:gamma carbonic anhydrase family protein [Nesterenkonia aerolata]|uniref:Gamma carbonic anhydrase family protein n=1 Tax=Nesterenkonia aerolata TaxID=3074079 RepID=A0ABU2DQP0_9MICC|nr:gamma carbonic anhydrase family protein [Nesterenkonia sp. LY-0111]MDR8018779.1 gamma carbonic anhydrase family protein [Nesterenkonia sp. LY-0111]
MAHIIPIRGAVPRVGEGVFLAPTAVLSGEVELADGASAFYGVSVRGDTAAIRVGAGTNLQDNVVLHADDGFPCTLGAGVSVGHSAVVHGATVGDDCLIGMSATVMNGAVIGEQSLVAAGALVLEGTQVPPRSLVAGVPAKVRRELSEEEVQGLRRNAEVYYGLRDAHREAQQPQAETHPEALEGEPRT